MAALPKHTPRTEPEGRRCGRIRVHGVTSSLGKVIDISGSGARIVRTGGPGLPDGRGLVLTLHSHPTGPFAVGARLVRTKPTGLLRRELAIAFIDVSDEARRHLSTIAQTCGLRDYGEHD